MTKYQNQSGSVVNLMDIQENNIYKFNVKKSTELKVGDKVQISEKYIISIEEILESKQSSLSEYNYVITRAKRE